MYKRNMVMIVFLVIAMSFSSCGRTIEKNADNGPLEVIFIGDDFNPNTMANPEDYTDWVGKYNEIYDDDISFTAIIPGTTALYNEFDIKSIVDETGNGGIVIMSLGYYASIIDQIPEYFEPIGEYIKNSGLSAEYAESILNFGRNSYNGDVWCFPIYQNNSRYIRFYDKNILDEWDSDVPDTLVELKEMLGWFRIQYDKPGLVLSEWGSSGIFHGVADIFALAGIPSTDTIVFDTNSDKFVNIMDYPGTVGILEYLKDLHENGLVRIHKDESYYNAYNGLMNNDVLTITQIWPGGMYKERLVPGGLSPEKESMLGGTQQTYYVALMLKDTVGAQKEFNEFADVFLRQGEGYLAASLGFEGIHYTIKNSYRVAEKYPEIPKPQIVHNNRMFANMITLDDDYDSYRYFNEEHLSERNRIAPLYAEYIMRDYRQIMKPETSNLFSEYFLAMFEEDADLDSLLDGYYEMCKNSGIDDIIEEANLRLKEMK